MTDETTHNEPPADTPVEQPEETTAAAVEPRGAGSEDAPAAESREPDEVVSAETGGAAGAGLAHTRAMTVAAYVLLGLTIFAMLAGVAWWVLFWPLNPQPAGTPVRVEVPVGSDTRRIGERLAEAGVVANLNMFLIRTRLSPENGKLKAGVYDLKTGMDYGSVLERLAKGPNAGYVNVVIPEGFTIDQIARRLHADAGIPVAAFTHLAKNGAKGFDRPFLKDNPTNSLEGYLFPKTYLVKRGSSPSDVIDMMLDQFAKETSGADLSYATSKNLSLHDVITIASMIERETHLPQERPLVASVVYNRLNKRMYLEIDATVQYILGGKSRLLNRDLLVDSPYNTYLHKGLPQGPICSPGLPSIEAAAHPAETAYIYYVLTGKDGSHTWATNRRDFLAAKAKARQGLR